MILLIRVRNASSEYLPSLDLRSSDQFDSSRNDDKGKTAQYGEIPTEGALTQTTGADKDGREDNPELEGTQQLTQRLDSVHDDVRSFHSDVEAALNIAKGVNSEDTSKQDLGG